MHSKQRLAQKYPSMSLDILERFYGKIGSESMRAVWNNMAVLGVDGTGNSSTLAWLTKIDLRDLFDDTYPYYHIYYCRIQHSDCRGYWRKVFRFSKLVPKFVLKFDRV